MGTLKNAELSALILHIARFLKSGIPIYNSNVPETVTKKNPRRTQAITKRLEFHKKCPHLFKEFLVFRCCNN